MPAIRVLVHIIPVAPAVPLYEDGGLYVPGECDRIPLSSVERQVIDLASPFRFRGGRGRRTKDNERNGRHEQDCANGGHGGAVLRRFRTARRADCRLRGDAAGDT